MSQVPKVLLFDLGGVLVDFAGFGELHRYLEESLSADEVRDRWILSPSVSAYERGALSTASFADQFVDEWQLKLSPDAFVSLFRGWFRGLYPGASELLIELRRKRQDLVLACLSNSNPAHWEKFRTQSEGLFDHSYLSFQLEAVKPDAAIFEKVVSGLGVAPRDILLLDDTPINVSQARAFGLQAEQVEGVAELKAKLTELRFL